jgi:hypothetical protein
VPAIPRTVGKFPSSATFVSDRLRVAGVVLFAICAAAQLIVVTGLVPSGLALTGLTGVSHADRAVAVVLALVSVDRIAMARDVTNAAALFASIARGICRPTGVRASWVALLAHVLFDCARYEFGPIARLPRHLFCGLSDVAALGAMSGGGRVR